MMGAQLRNARLGVCADYTACTVTSIVFFTRALPSSLSAPLAQAGTQVFEAMAISEVLYLCETENIDIVLIGADVDDYRAEVIAEHRITLRLKLDATAKEVIAELWQMFPEKSEYLV